MENAQSQQPLTDLAALAEPMLVRANADFFKECPDEGNPAVQSMLDTFPTEARRRFVAARQLDAAANFFKPSRDKDMHVDVDDRLLNELGAKSPAALAWVWMEMTPRERHVAQAMDPAMLVEWMAGSFGRLTQGMTPWTGSAPSTTQGDVDARAWGEQGAPIRRASRAKTLALILEGGQRWTGSVKALASMAQSLWSREGKVERAMAKAAKSAAFKTGQRWRAGAALFGSLGLFSTGVISGAISPGAASHAATLGGFGSLCVGLAMLVRLPSVIPGQDKKNQAWGRGAMSFLALAYPDLASQGVFQAWRAINPRTDLDGDGVYAGYELAGCGKAADLSKTAAIHDSLPEPGGPGLKAWMERRELALASPEPASSLKRPSSRL